MRIYVSWVLVIMIGLSATLFSTANKTVLHLADYEEIQRTGSGYINVLAYSPTADLLAAGTETGVYLYEIPTFTEVSNFGFFTLPIVRLKWSPDGRWLAFGTSANIYIWDSKTNLVTLLVEDLLNNDFDWALAGHELGAVGLDSEKRVVDGETVRDNMLYQWTFADTDIQTHVPVILPLKYKGIEAFIWGDGVMIVRGDWQISSIVAWPENKPEEVVRLETTTTPSQRLTTSPHKESVILDYYVDFDAHIIHRLDTKNLAWDNLEVARDISEAHLIEGKDSIIARDLVSYQITYVTILDNLTGALKQDFQLDYPMDRQNFVLAPDEGYAVSISRGQLILIDMTSWDIIATQPLTFRIGQQIYSGAFDAQHALTASKQWDVQSGWIIQITNTQTGETLGKIPQPTEDIFLMAFSPDSRYLALNHYSGALTIIDLASFTVIPDLEWTLPDAFSEMVWHADRIFIVSDLKLYSLPLNADGLPDAQAEITLFEPSQQLVPIYGLASFGDVILFSHSYALTPDQTLYAYRDQELLWQATSTYLAPHSLSPDGRFGLTLNAYFVIQVRDIYSGEIMDERQFWLEEQKRHPYVRVASTAWHPNGYVALSAGSPAEKAAFSVQIWMINEQGHFRLDEPFYLVDSIHQDFQFGCCTGITDITQLWWHHNTLYSASTDGTLRAWGIPD